MNFGTNYLRTEGMSSITFTTDAHGKPLAALVNLLVAGPSELNPGTARLATAWTRDDAIGTWSQSTIGRMASAGGARSFGSHMDSATGVHHIFAGLSDGAIVRGGYDPKAPGRLSWDTPPELEGDGRVMAFVEANGALYAATGLRKTAGKVNGGLFRRIDGVSPRWELLYQWKYTDGTIGDELNLMRGLTAVPDPNGGDSQVLLATRANPGVAERIDPPKNHAVTVELDIKAYFARA